MKKTKSAGNYGFGHVNWNIWENNKERYLLCIAFAEKLVIVLTTANFNFVTGRNDLSFFMIAMSWIVAAMGNNCVIKMFF